MGHSEEIVIGDANFPGETLPPRVLRADCLRVSSLLGAILLLVPLDDHAPSALVMMKAAAGAMLDTAEEAPYRHVGDTVQPEAAPIERRERFAIYERAHAAYAVDVSGELVKDGKSILKKGVVLPATYA